MTSTWSVDAWKTSCEVLKNHWWRSGCGVHSPVPLVSTSVSSCSVVDTLPLTTVAAASQRLWLCAEGTDELLTSSDLYQAISELPQPNRDTLAYIILHLQRSFLFLSVPLFCFHLTFLSFSIISSSLLPPYLLLHMSCSPYLRDG